MSAWNVSWKAETACVLVFDGFDVGVAEVPVLREFAPLSTAQLFRRKSPQHFFHHFRLRMLCAPELDGTGSGQPL